MSSKCWVSPMREDVLMGSVARFERASTGSGLTVTTDDLRGIIPDLPEEATHLDGNTWHAVGLELFKGFDLVTWGNE